MLRDYKERQKTLGQFIIGLFLLHLALLVGWVMNLYTVVTEWESISIVEGIARIAGAFTFYLGGIMGFF